MKAKDFQDRIDTCIWLFKNSLNNKTTNIMTVSELNMLDGQIKHLVDYVIKEVIADAKGR